MKLFRFGALIVVSLITYLSNTPHLMVSHIHTWINSSQYEHVTLYDVFKKGSPFYQPWGGDRSIEFYLHKLGHFTFYGSLAIFLFWKSSSFKKTVLKLILIAGFAFLDEVHQFFIVGRSGRLMDVAFDIFSVICFLILISILESIFKFIKYIFKEKEFRKNRQSSY